MASKRERVLEAVTALVRGALPNADVKRGQAKPEDPAPGGGVVIGDGDPGEPEVDLSPLSYNYSHRIPLELAPWETDTPEEAFAALDEMLQAIGAGIKADRFLGGLCQFLSAEAPTTDDLEAFGVDAGRWALVMLVAEYAASGPLN